MLITSISRHSKTLFLVSNFTCIVNEPENNLRNQINSLKKVTLFKLLKPHHSVLTTGITTLIHFLVSITFFFLFSFSLFAQDQTFTVTQSGFKYFINGEETPVIQIEKGKTYREKRKNYHIDFTRIFWIMDTFLDLIKDIWDFLKVRKKYWLAPLIITIVLMGTLIVFTQGSVVAPFIYSIF